MSQLSAAVDVVKQHLMERERQILGRSQLKIHLYVEPQMKSLLAATSPKIADVRIGIDKVGTEWHLCIEYWEDVKGRMLRRCYAVGNMSSWHLLDTFRNVQLVQEMYDYEITQLESLYFDAASSIIRTRTQ